MLRSTYLQGLDGRHDRILSSMEAIIRLAVSPNHLAVTRDGSGKVNKGPGARVAPLLDLT